MTTTSHESPPNDSADRGASMLASIPWLFHTLDQKAFIARRPDSELFVSGTGIKVGSRGTTLLEMTFLDSTQPFPGQMVPQKRYGDAVTNYVLGSEPTDWHVGLALWEELLVADVYPLVDVLYYTDPAGQLEYDFLLKAGADPNLIRFTFTGHSSINLEDEGSLVVFMRDGSSFTLLPPSIYQDIDGSRVQVSGGFHLAQGDVIGFWLGAYDTSLPLVIDPVLTFSTYFGGHGLSYDYGFGVVVDSNGNIALTGYTNALKFPGMNAYDTTGGSNKIFITKFSSNGTLLFSTLFGGSGDNRGNGIAVDSSDNIVLVGYTTSTDLPTLNAYSSGNSGSNDIVVAKFNSSGSLIFSTYFGGSLNDFGNAIAVDSSDNIVITGYTGSTNFPTLNAYSSANSGSNDIIIAKFSSTGSLIFSTYFGGLSGDQGNSIAVDNSGNIVITGSTSSTNFPTLSAYSSANSGSNDIIIAKFSSTGSLIFSTYFGGSTYDYGSAVALDSSNNIVITGYTSSTNFPTLNAYSSGNSGSTDIIVAKFSSSGSLTFSTYFGGSLNDFGNAIAVDSSDNIVITGYTTSTNFPILNAYSSGNSGSLDIIVAKFSSSGSLTFSTYFGGSANDIGYGIAVDSSDNIAITGWSASTNFPTLNAYSSGNGGLNDVVVAKFNSTGSLLFSTYLGGSNDEYGYSISNGRRNEFAVTGITLSNNFPMQSAYDSEFKGGQNIFLTVFSFCSAFDGCSLHGECTPEETCICDAGWDANSNCSVPTCYSFNNCSNHGSCISPDVCSCDAGWTNNANCSDFECYSLSTCSTHGNCTGPDTCTCDSGWGELSNCSSFECYSLSNCSNHGNCTGPDTCSCDPGWGELSNCSAFECYSLSNCSSHGNCAGPDTCTCDSGWGELSNCSSFECYSLSNCSNHGNCTGPDTCSCEVGWDAISDCSVPTCYSLNNCSNHGSCISAEFVVVILDGNCSRIVLHLNVIH